MHCSSYILFLLFCASGSSEFLPHVKIQSGEVRGILDQSISGKEFYSFNGIPYAEPPVGKYRFKESMPSQSWEGVLEANETYTCLQYYYTLESYSVSGVEDCLYVNVYTPDLEGNFDVFVYIHGGGFMTGSSATVKPHILMDRDVVVVTFNYRVGPLGFLSTEDDVLPGNDGLKDQILALKWIQDNIKYFGGNPNSITISGTSAGGASVHFHTLSPKSKGLFHKAISSSGCMLNPWSLMEKPLDRTKKIASSLGCENENIQEMIDCLREKPGDQIVLTVHDFEPWQDTPFSPFAPVVDNWSFDPVLPEQPYKLLKDKKVNDVPWILGHMSLEGHCNGFNYYSEETLKYLDENWNELMPNILFYNFTIQSCDDLNSVGEKIREEYLDTEPPSRENITKLLSLTGDRLFNADFDKALRLHAAAIQSPVYNYLFSYRGVHSNTEYFTQTNKDFGAAHADDLMYFMAGQFDSLSTENDRAISKLIVDMYLSFAKVGQPKMTNVSWTPVSKNVKDPIKYLNINSPKYPSDEEIEILGNRIFWDSLPFEENEKLFENKTFKLI